MAAVLGATLSGCITVNVPEETEVSAPVPAVDYSGALSNLSLAVGALAKSSSANPTAEDCSYTAYVATQMDVTTPDPSWQGTFEKIQSNMQSIGRLYANNPADVDARSFAGVTRADVVRILNDENYAGVEWG